MRVTTTNYHKRPPPVLLDQEDQDKIRDLNSPKEEPAFHFTYKKDDDFIKKQMDGLDEIFDANFHVAKVGSPREKVNPVIVQMPEEDLTSHKKHSRKSSMRKSMVSNTSSKKTRKELDSKIEMAEFKKYKHQMEQRKKTGEGFSFSNQVSDKIVITDEDPHKRTFGYDDITTSQIKDIKFKP